LRVAKDRAEVLLKEVNHRVANSLSLVAALVNLQASAITDAAAKKALSETQSRIYAISMVHKRLYSSSDARYVALDEYLGGLLEHLQHSLRDEWSGTRFDARLDAILLKTDQSVNLGIIVAEWITNACKYAYPNGFGEVRVRLQRVSDGWAELSVEDDGVGRSDDAASKGTGLGTRIVRAMAESMNGTIEYGTLMPGTVARLSFPVLR
jgi:two-component sensor histidine kinase